MASRTMLTMAAELDHVMVVEADGGRYIALDVILTELGASFQGVWAGNVAMDKARLPATEDALDEAATTAHVPLHVRDFWVAREGLKRVYSVRQRIGHEALKKGLARRPPQE